MQKKKKNSCDFDVAAKGLGGENLLFLWLSVFSSSICHHQIRFQLLDRLDPDFRLLDLERELDREDDLERERRRFLELCLSDELDPFYQLPGPGAGVCSS